MYVLEGQSRLPGCAPGLLSLPTSEMGTAKDISPGWPQSLPDIAIGQVSCLIPIVGTGMRRREFLGVMGSAASLPLAALAQQPAEMKRLAMVHPSDPVGTFVPSYHRSYRAFFDELSRLGFVEGKNLVVERYSAEGQPDRYAKLAYDVVDRHPDVIFSMSGSVGLAFKAATTTIPIVTTASDPLAQGLVSNIAKPGGNLTGTSVNAGLEIWGKRIGLLKETLPKLSNLCVLA